MGLFPDSIIESLSLTFLSMHLDKSVHSLTLLRDISLRWGVVCLVLYNTKKILEINFTYGSLKQPMDIKVLWRVTTLFIYHRIGVRVGLFGAK